MDIPYLLRQSFDTLVYGAQPAQCLQNIDLPDFSGRLIVVGAGKAAAAMANAFEDIYDHHSIEGMVITRYGHSVPTKHIKVIEAAHPVPDLAGQQAVYQMMELLSGAGIDDLVVCLISGGGSSLMSAPVEGVNFDEIRDINRVLLKSGASITEINTVRKHLNCALGGGLAAAAHPARMVTFTISDVAGNDPSVIASGASVPDPSTLAEARAILEKYDIDVSDAVTHVLQDIAMETPKPNDPMFEGHEYHCLATARTALQTAADFWDAQGFTSHIFELDVEGDTNQAARDHVAYLQRIIDGDIDIPLPCAILSGGETTVKITGNGQGGPNTQFMLQAAMLLDGHPQISGMACDTDGIDGSQMNAGAFITPDTMLRAQERHIAPRGFLDSNDSYRFFEQIDGLVMSGPTLTNVNDYRVFLIFPAH